MLFTVAVGQEQHQRKTPYGGDRRYCLLTPPPHAHYPAPVAPKGGGQQLMIPPSRRCEWMIVALLLLQSVTCDSSDLRHCEAWKKSVPLCE